MPVKYQCEKCGRRFAEWGAEKLGFKCPQDDKCENIGDGEIPELIRVGQLNEKPGRKPSLKRTARKIRAATPDAAVFDEAIDEADVDADEFDDKLPDDSEEDDILPADGADGEVDDAVEVSAVDADGDDTAPIPNAEVVTEAGWEEE